jgi:hypothetical protein
MMINSFSKELFVSFAYGIVPPLIMFEETYHTKLCLFCPVSVLLMSARVSSSMIFSSN